VIGALRGETSELLAARERGMTEREWQDESWPYLQRMIETGQYPMIAKVVREATHPPSEVVFERGLDCVIEGVLSRLGRGAS
jgi:Tetracyclin repressor-like, C-terminal domain